MIDLEPLIQRELDNLVPLPDGLRADWSDVVRRARLNRASRPQLRAVSGRLAAVGVAVAVAGVATVAYAIREDHTPLAPAKMSALANPKTVVPTPARDFGGLGDPLPGTVHQLGFGALAWRSQRAICWVGPYAENLSGGAGGCVSEIPQPINWTVKDPDAPGAGAPPRVFGLAIDAVKLVTVTLKDGRRASGAPVDNFYLVTLPGDAIPADVVNVQASLADGSVFSQLVPPESAGGGSSK